MLLVSTEKICIKSNQYWQNILEVCEALLNNTAAKLVKKTERQVELLGQHWLSLNRVLTVTVMYDNGKELDFGCFSEFCR